MKSALFVSAVALLMGSCSPTPSGSSGGSVDARTDDVAPLLSAEQEAEAAVVAGLSEVSQPGNPYALSKEEISGVEGEGLTLSDEEWQALQALTPPQE